MIELLIVFPGLKFQHSLRMVTLCVKNTNTFNSVRKNSQLKYSLHAETGKLVLEVSVRRICNKG